MDKLQTTHGFKIGEKVWIKPNDDIVLKGTVKGFQYVEPYLPIVESISSRGQAFSNAFALNRINHYREGKYFYEYRLVKVKH